MNVDAKIKDAKQDTKVTNAAAHWGPRFTVNGVDFSDFKDVTSALHSWDDWCRAWSARAGEHEARGRAALAQKRYVSARDHLLRASVTYHFAKYLFVQDMAQMKAAHGKAVECLTAALPHMEPPGERVLIPYEGKELAGVLRKPRGVQKPPIVLMTMGLDSTKEELVTFQQTFLDRGMAILAFDGPGQGEAEYDFPIRPDYENVVGPVIDWLEARRPDVDSKRLGIWGISLGGYYAPRAAAFEKRFKLCVAWGANHNWGELQRRRLAREGDRPVPHYWDHVMWVWGKDSLEAFMAFVPKISLAGVVENIRVPFLITHGANDRQIPLADAHQSYNEAVNSPLRELKIFTDREGGVEHVGADNMEPPRSFIADWVADRFAEMGASA